MSQSSVENLVGLNVCDGTFEGFGTEDSKPVRSLVGGVHIFLTFPQGHREQLTVLRVGEEQATAVTHLHPERWDDVLFDLPVPHFEALRAHVEPGYPREHSTTAF